MADMVNSPPHYTQGKFETIDVIEDAKLGYHLGNAVKYIMRSSFKGKQDEDLAKAIWYIQRHREVVVKELDLGWAAGILEGEGCFGWYGPHNGYALVQLGSTDEDVINRFANLFEGITTRRPPPMEGRKQVWEWRAHGEKAVVCMKTVLPYMSKRRANKITKCLLRWHEVQDNKMDKDALRKIQCKHGHKFADTGEYVVLSGKRKGKKKCAECARISARKGLAKKTTQTFVPDDVVMYPEDTEYDMVCLVCKHFKSVLNKDLTCIDCLYPQGGNIDPDPHVEEATKTAIGDSDNPYMGHIVSKGSESHSKTLSGKDMETPYPMSEKPLGAVSEPHNYVSPESRYPEHTARQNAEMDRREQYRELTRKVHYGTHKPNTDQLVMKELSQYEKD